MKWSAFILCLVFTALSLPATTMNAGMLIGMTSRGGHSAISWSSARPIGYSAVPSYQPLSLANGANISLAPGWRGHWADITGLYSIGLRPYDAVSGRWITDDSVFDESNPNGFSAFGGDPINGFDSDGRCMETGLNFGAHAFDTVWNTVMTTLFTPAPVQEAPPDVQQRMGQNFLDSGIGSPMKNWLGIDYSPNPAVDNIPTTYGPLIQNAVNSFGVGQTTAAIPNVDVQTEPAPTLQDYLPAAQTILDNTKAQYGNVEAYNMASPSTSAADSAQSQVFATVNTGNAPYSELNGAIGEEQGWQDALARSEMPIQAPKPTSVQGPDYITYDANNQQIIVYDSKYRAPGSSYPSTIPQTTLSSWMPAVAAAVNAMPPGPAKVAAQTALKNGQVVGQVFKWPN